MFERAYKKYTILRCIGVLLLICALLVPFSMAVLRGCLWTMTAFLCLSLLFYGQTLYKVCRLSHLPAYHLPLALALHGLSAASLLCAVINRAYHASYPALYLFFTALIFRVAFGIERFDFEMKDVCKQLDRDLHAQTQLPQSPA